MVDLPESHHQLNGTLKEDLPDMKVVTALEGGGFIQHAEEEKGQEGP